MLKKGEQVITRRHDQACPEQADVSEVMRSGSHNPEALPGLVTRYGAIHSIGVVCSACGV